MTSPPLHEELCFPCWMKALGVDHTVASTLMITAFAVGAGAGAGRLASNLGMPLPVAQAGLAAHPVVLDQELISLIERRVRDLLARPASPEVAAAMEGHRHDG